MPTWGRSCCAARAAGSVPAATCARARRRKWHGDAANAHEEWRDSLRGAMEASRLLHQIPKPTIAMIRGPAAGAGLSLATACDLRIASTTAIFTTAFVKVGFSGDFGITYFLTRLVGTAKARELMFLSDKIDAAEALRIGLVNRVVPDEALEAQTMASRGRSPAVRASPTATSSRTSTRPRRAGSKACSTWRRPTSPAPV